MSAAIPAFIQALQQPSAYPHPVRGIQLLQTHISWVLLTGTFVYKIKKPVNLGFLDFSSLDKRRFYCEEELRLNRRLAPDIYLDVVIVTGAGEQACVGGNGAVVDYAVRMRQFDPDNQFDRLLASGRLSADMFEQCAAYIARFHDGAEVAATRCDYGTAEAVEQAVMDNFAVLTPALSATPAAALLQRVQAWCTQETTRLRSAFAQRKAHGFVRECHGDLHLANLALYQHKPLAFDCLEFNAQLRWIDVMAEIAFLVMDLDRHGRRDLARRFLDVYLQHSGDYAGLKLLAYYCAYRALVRAKVECIRLQQNGAAPASSASLQAYLQLAEIYTQPRSRGVIITYGLSGSGKTTVGSALLEVCGLIRVRSDVERKRLFGLAPEARTRSELGVEIYAPSAGERTYQRLIELAGSLLDAGFSVLVDATFLQARQRRLFRALAAHRKVPFLIIETIAPEAELKRRIAARESAGRDASEANLAVLDAQIQQQEPLTAEERRQTLSVDSRAPDIEQLSQRVNGVLTGAGIVSAANTPA